MDSIQFDLLYNMMLRWNLYLKCGVVIFGILLSSIIAWFIWKKLILHYIRYFIKFNI